MRTKGLGFITRAKVGIVWTVFSSGLAVAGPHEHEGDVIVGRTDEGRLSAEIPQGDPIELSPIDGLLRGWAGDEPGFLSLETDEPDEGFFILEKGAIVSLELVAIDPGFKLWRPGFAGALTAPGDSLILGPSSFDTHGTFHVDLDDPAFDAEITEYSAEFRLVDTGSTAYAPSEPFTLTFTTVPEPASVLLLGLGAMSLAARTVRRRGAGSER